MTHETETTFRPVDRAPAYRRSSSRGNPDETRFCIGIATRGRPLQVQSVINHLREQTLQPEAVLVSCVDRGDVGELRESDRLRIFEGQPGLARQRNIVLENLTADAEFVAFFDDDFYPHKDWLRVAGETFRNDPTVVCITGNVVADGICGPGLTYDNAVVALESMTPARHPWVIDNYSPYGCNMAFRRSAIEGLRFDERLVLYGWLEDRDFGAQVAKGSGRVVKLGAAIGVHLGVKNGRVSGRRLGYSQVMNPYYMHRKRTMTKSEAVLQVLRNLSANAAKSLSPEPYIDRRGRLVGNMIAIGDILTGWCRPERAEQL
jgi:glycosyltransferase involved in cell wall biosynthesis